MRRRALIGLGVAAGVVAIGAVASLSHAALMEQIAQQNERIAIDNEAARTTINGWMTTLAGYPPEFESPNTLSQNDILHGVLEGMGPAALKAGQLALEHIRNGAKAMLERFLERFDGTAGEMCQLIHRVLEFSGILSIYEVDLVLKCYRNQISSRELIVDLARFTIPRITVAVASMYRGLKWAILKLEDINAGVYNVIKCMAGVSALAWACNQCIRCRFSNVDTIRESPNAVLRRELEERVDPLRSSYPAPQHETMGPNDWYTPTCKFDELFDFVSNQSYDANVALCKLITDQLAILSE